MLLRPLTNGAVTGNFEIYCPTRILGAVIITANGTNDAVVVVRRVDRSERGSVIGKIILQYSTKFPLSVQGPFEASEYIYISVSGTGAAAQFYEWVE